jgi:hypothetical protein
MESAATISQEYKELLEGLDFILEHFPKYEPLFPRNIMTKVLADLGKGQRIVYDKGTMISHFEGARRRDCRIGAYLKYDDLIKKGLLPPTYKPKPTQLFIDLDLSSFGKDNRLELDAVLYDTLNNIKQHLNGAIPTVLWTGGGYHVYLPLDPDCVPIYEELPEFQRFKDDKFPPSVKLLRYAEKRLTNGKSDSEHRPSFESCLWRIPGSINSKYEGEENAKVKIIQRWNGIRARPTKDFMITDFHAYLVQEVIEQKVKELVQAERIKKSGGSFRKNRGSIPETYRYIEDKLLKTPIEDYRKKAVDVIIIPYLVVIKGMTDINQIQDITMQWLDKCDELRRLDSRHAFAARIWYRTHQVIEAHSKGEAIPPKKWETLKDENPELYKLLNVPS